MQQINTDRAAITEASRLALTELVGLHDTSIGYGHLQTSRN